MAEVNKRSSTSGANGKRGKPQKNGKSKKTDQKQSVNEDNDTQVTCSKCLDVFVDDNDKLMGCERCSKWFCVECLGLSDIEYEVMGRRNDFHWFCQDCEKPAITAVLTDKQIEERCAAYMETMTGRIVELEGNLESKADKGDVANLEERVKKLEGNDTITQSDVQKQSDTVRMTIDEQRERELRKKSIIIQNLQESKRKEFEDRKADDIELVEKLFCEIGVDEEDVVENCERIGKKDPVKNRITKVNVSSVGAWKRILRGSRALKDNIDYKDVFIGPDLTKMQRSEEFNLRKELRARRDNGETDIFIRGGKIVQRQQRALQFRGRATSDSEGEE